LELDEEEFPKTESVDYILEPADTKTSTDAFIVLFVVDVSGSMCVSKEVPGDIKIKGYDTVEKEFSALLTREDVQIDKRKKKVTYISRLQSVQAAVDAQLAALHTLHPQVRVGLITFANDVTLIGDGSATPVTIAGDKLNDQVELSKIGTEHKLNLSIKDTRESLRKKKNF